MRATIPCPICNHEGRQTPLKVTLTKSTSDLTAWEYKRGRCEICGDVSGVIYLDTVPESNINNHMVVLGEAPAGFNRSMLETPDE